MQLAMQFEIVSPKPACVEFDKPYPIMGACIHTNRTNITIITLSLQMSDVGEDFRVGHCDLSPAYSRGFDNDIITERNANPGKFKLVHRKKDCCDYCHFLVIET
jgi:hypothetical protein